MHRLFTGRRELFTAGHYGLRLQTLMILTDGETHSPAVSMGKTAW